MLEVTNYLMGHNWKIPWWCDNINRCRWSGFLMLIVRFMALYELNKGFVKWDWREQLSGATEVMSTQESTQLPQLSSEKIPAGVDINAVHSFLQTLSADVQTKIGGAWFDDHWVLFFPLKFCVFGLAKPLLFQRPS